ncbi:unnamed protein product [Rotaria magnacalcarata]|uniref:Uncharacterized protein n=1 Tax=Rotaria magnacalcarata TaxID=392030 RepID=A0A8S3HAV0_9BILA|nr:unnamed protein product [Rotaria magnacalcarata]
MSRGTVQRKATLKKLIERDSSIGDRTSDDEAVIIEWRKKMFIFFHIFFLESPKTMLSILIQKEKQKNVLSRNDAQKINNQLDMLREILFNQHDVTIHDLIKRSSRSDKPIAKNDIVR